MDSALNAGGAVGAAKGEPDHSAINSVFGEMGYDLPYVDVILLLAAYVHTVRVLRYKPSFVLLYTLGADEPPNNIQICLKSSVWESNQPL